MNGSIVVDQGNHEDLIKNSKIYKNFYENNLEKINVFYPIEY